MLAFGYPPADDDYLVIEDEEDARSRSGYPEADDWDILDRIEKESALWQ